MAGGDLREMTPMRRCRRARPALALAALLALASGVGTSCTTQTPDKRILQYLNQEGFGRRYVGNSVEENYVTIGDTVSFTDTYNPDEIRGIETVDVDGTIQLPEAGSVFVAGLTRSELETYLSQKLAPFWTQTDVKVVINGGTGRVYFVLGEVATEGAYPFTGDVTVFEAVMRAHPGNHTANLGRVKIIRPDPKDPLIIPVDVTDMWKNGDSTSNVSLQELDIVYVPPTFMKQTANFVSGLLTPFLEVFNDIIRTIFFFDGTYLNRGFGRRGGYRNY